MTEPYAGPIEVGARFWWAPDNGDPRALLEVTGLHRDGWVYTKTLDFQGRPDLIGQAAANTEARFREAVTPTEVDLPDLQWPTAEQLIDEDGAAYVVISNTDPTAAARLRRFVKLREQASLSDWGPGPDLDTEGARIDTAGDHTPGV